MDQPIRLTDVYGITRDVPANYIARENIDGELLERLTQDKHLVLYGSSKQGKTCLRKWNLHDHEYLVVTCSNRWDLAQLHSAILRRAGYTVEQSSTRTTKGTNKITAKLTGKLGFFGVGVGAEAGGEQGREDQDTTTTTPLELDPADVNDIIQALNTARFTGYIVLEDFHYLPGETQRDFAIALKAFHESSRYSFIIVGVWLDENRLVQFNGDLTGRVIAINADKWTEDQLHEVMAKGEQLLNILLEQDFKARLIKSCFESVWVVQDTCYRACYRAGVHFRQAEPISVGSANDVSALVREVVDTQSARYNSFISGFASGFIDTTLEMYRWLLLPILVTNPDELELGLSYTSVRKIIDEHHPAAPINAGNLTQALKSTASLQVKIDITPIILDYNQSRRRLDVVDRSFLIWLKRQNLSELLANAGLPSDITAVPSESQTSLFDETFGSAAGRPTH